MFIIIIISSFVGLLCGRVWGNIVQDGAMVGNQGPSG